MKLSKAIVKYRIPILILAVVLLIPATIGYLNTRVNYDMLDYSGCHRNGSGRL